MFGNLKISALFSIGIAAQQLVCMYVTPIEQPCKFPTNQEYGSKNYFSRKGFPIQSNAQYQNRDGIQAFCYFEQLPTAPACWHPCKLRGGGYLITMKRKQIAAATINMFSGISTGQQTVFCSTMLDLLPHSLPS